MIRVFALSLLFGLSCIYAEESHSQIRISIDVKDAELKEVFENIERKTNFIFFYTDGVDNSKRKVSIKANNETVAKILEEILRPDFSFEVVDRQIIVSPARGTVDPTALPGNTGSIQSLVTGVVQDLDGSPIIGASVYIKGATTGVITDFDGKFSLQAALGNTLVFSYLGMRPQEIVVTGFTPMTVVMQEDVSELNEVVVTGYQTQEKRTITGAISQMKAEEIANLPVQSFDQALQGRMAGVLVQGGSGNPGGPIRVEIRGVGSISAGTQPLYIVDGVEINSEDAASNVAATNPLAFLNPDDIESIEVLKDAAAASIYGAQAANGVVLITTKGGKAGPTRFSVNYEKGITTSMPLMEMLNSQQYLDVRMQAVGNANPGWTPAQVRTQVLEQNSLPITMTDADIAALPSYDWQEEAFDVGLHDKINLAMTGGTERTKFRVSTSFEKTEGSVAPNDFSRGSLYIRLNHDVNDRLNLWFSTNLSSVTQNASYRSYGSYAYFSSPQYTAPHMLPFLPIYNEDGSYNAPYERFPGQLPYNALHGTEINTQVARTKNLLGNFRLSYKILDNLTWQTRVGLNYRVYDTEFYIDPRTQEANARGGYKSFRYQNSYVFTNSNTLVYDTSLMGGHNINALLGVEYRAYQRQRVGASAEGFPTYQFRYLSSASTILDAYENGSQNKRAGAFGQLNYNFKKKYMVSGVLRYDGSSRFGLDNKYGLFPAISAGWDISRESFMDNQNWARQLKLRLSYGETGNSSISDFGSRALWNGSGSYGGQAGTLRSQLGNEELRWERNVSYNLGLDFTLAKKFLYGSVDAFQRTSKDLLLNTPLPWTSGFSNIYRNVGEVQNKGLEIDLNSDLVNTRNFKWSANFNISFLKNKVTKLYEGVVETADDEETTEEVSSLPGSPGIRLGWPLYTNFRSQYAGVNAATGKPMWWYGQDRLTYTPGSQGGTSYTPHGRGNRLSDYYGGLSNTFSYKDFSLNVFFQYDMGRELYNQTNVRNYGNGSVQRNTLERAYDLSWQQPGQVTAFPRPIDGGVEELASDGNLASTRYLEDASYIRLKQILFKYKLPKRFMPKGLTSFDAHFSANNVLTWTKWTGYDPEFYIDDSNFTSNTGQIPQTRSFVFGINVGF